MFTQRSSIRDVTDHLQLLLRKAGHHLHTSAEREVVRTIKEKCCYVALNPIKEEKDSLGRTEEFRLPDGNVVQVSYLQVQGDQMIKLFCSSAQSDSVHQKSSSIQNSSDKSMPVYTKWSWILSTESISI